MTKLQSRQNIYQKTWLIYKPWNILTYRSDDTVPVSLDLNRTGKAVTTTAWQARYWFSHSIWMVDGVKQITLCSTVSPAREGVASDYGSHDGPPQQPTGLSASCKYYHCFIAVNILPSSWLCEFWFIGQRLFLSNIIKLLRRFIYSLGQASDVKIPRDIVCWVGSRGYLPTFWWIYSHLRWVCGGAS